MCRCSNRFSMCYDRGIIKQICLSLTSLQLCRVGSYQTPTRQALHQTTFEPKAAISTACSPHDVNQTLSLPNAYIPVQVRDFFSFFSSQNRDWAYWTADLPIRPSWEHPSLLNAAVLLFSSGQQLVNFTLLSQKYLERGLYLQQKWALIWFLQ